MRPSVCLAAAVATQASVLELGKKTLFGSAPMPDVNRGSVAHIRPSKDISLHYESSSGSVTANTNVNVTHVMKYPTVLLEEIAALIHVDCSATSVAMTFNDPAVFTTARGTWSTNQTLVLITNHLGDCDEELERSFFIAKKLTWDSKTLVCTANAEKTDVEHTAATTEITFGGLPAIAGTRKRALVLDPSFTIAQSFGLPSDTTLYKYDPYLTVTANTATFAASATFSGYLKYNWFGFKLEQLYFDLDASFETQLALTASVLSSYDTTFSYAPEALQYGFVLPGIIEIGPQLTFSVDAHVAASEAVNITAAVGVKLTDGNVHLDLVKTENTSTSGWVPAYTASTGISGVAIAQIDPTASVGVELEIKLFGGLVDLTSGITARPGFTNKFTLTAKETIATSGTIGGKAATTTAAATAAVSAIAAAKTCPNGLAIDSDFNFVVDAKVTQWWTGQLYSVSVPIADECYSWK